MVQLQVSPDISNVFEHLDYPDDFIAARRHLTCELSAEYSGEKIIAAWNAGKRLRAVHAAFLLDFKFNSWRALEL